MANPLTEAQLSAVVDTLNSRTPAKCPFCAVVKIGTELKRRAGIAHAGAEAYKQYARLDIDIRKQKPIPKPRQPRTPKSGESSRASGSKVAKTGKQAIPPPGPTTVPEIRRTTPTGASKTLGSSAGRAARQEVDGPVTRQNSPLTSKPTPAKRRPSQPVIGASTPAKRLLTVKPNPSPATPPLLRQVRSSSVPLAPAAMRAPQVDKRSSSLGSPASTADMGFRERVPVLVGPFHNVKLDCSL